MNLTDGAGYLMGDLGLAMIVCACALLCWVALPSVRRTDRLALAMLAFGWTLLALRLTGTLLAGGDPQIAPVSLLAVALIGTGQALGMLRMRARKPPWKQ